MDMTPATETAFEAEATVTNTDTLSDKVEAAVAADKATDTASVSEEVKETLATSAPEIKKDAGKKLDGTAKAETATAEKYTPSYKYKVKDNELEFEEWLKPLVKDKPTEEKLRDLLTRSHGIEEVKKSRDDFRSRLDDLEPKYKNIDSSLTYLSELVNKGDVRSFVDGIKLPKKELLQYAIEELKYLQLPVEERNRIDTQRAEQERLVSLESQNVTLQDQLYRASVQTREQELSMVTSRPDVQTVVNQFNAMVGKPDAFRAKVVEKGLTHFHLTGQDLTAQQAVDAVLSEVGPFLRASTGTVTAQTGGQAQMGGVQNTSQAGQPVVVRETKPTLPNIQSGGVSPVKKQPRSLDDLRKLRAQLNG